MSGRPNIQPLYQAFVSGDPLVQEKLFSLSCFDLSHWEESPNWSITDDEIWQGVRSTIQGLIGGSWWSTFLDDGGEDWLERALYGGILSNQLLSWYLSQKLGYASDYESLTNTNPFDVQLIDSDLPICDLEIKRLASTNSIETEVAGHMDKCRRSSAAPYTALFIYFPIGDDEFSHRVNDLLKGYIYTFSNNIDFFDNDENYLCPIPAPIDPSEDDILPLQKSAKILRNEIGLDPRS